MSSTAFHIESGYTYMYQFHHEFNDTGIEVSVTCYFVPKRNDCGRNVHFDEMEFFTVIEDLDVVISCEDLTPNRHAQLLADHGGELESWILADRRSWVKLNPFNDPDDPDDAHEDYALSMWAREIDEYPNEF